MGSAMSRLTWEDGQRGEEAGSRSIMDLLHSGFVNLGLKSGSQDLRNRARVHVENGLKCIVLEHILKNKK